MALWELWEVVGRGYMLSAGCSRFVEYMKAFSQWCMMVHAIIVFLSSVNASSLLLVCILI